VPFQDLGVRESNFMKKMKFYWIACEKVTGRWQAAAAVTVLINSAERVINHTAAYCLCHVACNYKVGSFCCK
jgi:hypothetical protein